MSQQRKTILVATVALILGVAAFVPSSGPLAPEPSNSPSLQSVGDDQFNKYNPYNPKIMVTDRNHDVWEFTLNPEAVEAVFVSPPVEEHSDENDRRARRISSLLDFEWQGEGEGFWADTLYTSDLVSFLRDGEPLLVEDLRGGIDTISITLGARFVGTNAPKTPEICIKLRNCQIVCEPD